MEPDELAELLEEVEALRRQVAALSEAVADARARRLQQESLVARLREELRRERARLTATVPEA